MSTSTGAATTSRAAEHSSSPPTGGIQSASASQKPKVVAPGTDKFGELDNDVVLHSSSIPAGRPQKVRDILLSPPVVRQWFENGTLHREAAAHVPARVETFFDLIFIGLINRLATAVLDKPGGDAIARFVLTFYPAWAVWFEARRYGNVSGTDDLMHRTWVLVAMFGMVGYIGNASAIVLYPSTAAEHDFSSSTVRAAVAFWLVLRLVHACVLAAQSWRMPKMRLGLAMWSAQIWLPMFVYLPLCWVTSRKAQIAIAAVGMSIDQLPLDKLLFGVVARIVVKHMSHSSVSSTATTTHQDTDREGEGDWNKEKNLSPKLGRFDSPPQGMCLPAMNIEHAVLRMGGFLGLIMGTTIVGLVYTATDGQVGASSRWGKSCLGLMVAFGVNLIYGLQTERMHKFQHALRRSWWTAHLFLWLHWPLCASAIIMNAAAGRLANLDEVPNAVVWYWGCGLGFTVLFMTLIASLHKDLRNWRSSRLPRFARLGMGFCCALALVLAPLAAGKVSTMGWLGIGASLVWVVILTETFGALARPSAKDEGPG
ncbi:hypothetical protein CspeluHIS016_0405950 [Cutaneotrichosporon spelunceum]|uniref:Uncharacterized protein n=1 Tax=Cutaneotrichosporon spelunceum TaxID=1672016 RepID=A0AAD3TVS9_9TREE|nr:hypothetical protein CspeluHIS016_0405950 [Cutaneotrichosporon spelunceum]